MSKFKNMYVRRGGSWYSFRKNARCAYRNNFHPDSCDFFLGFRLVKPNEPNEQTNKYTLCGGSWSKGSTYARATFRYYYDPDLRNNLIGFRVLMTE